MHGKLQMVMGFMEAAFVRMTEQIPVSLLFTQTLTPVLHTNAAVHLWFSAPLQSFSCRGLPGCLPECRVKNVVCCLWLFAVDTLVCRASLHLVVKMVPFGMIITWFFSLESVWYSCCSDEAGCTRRKHISNCRMRHTE